MVGLKSDLRDDPETISKLNKSKKQPISQEAGMNYSKQVRAAGYLECSARTQVSTCLDTTRTVSAWTYYSFQKFQNAIFWRYFKFPLVGKLR